MRHGRTKGSKKRSFNNDCFLCKRRCFCGIYKMGKREKWLPQKRREIRLFLWKYASRIYSSCIRNTKRNQGGGRASTCRSSFIIQYVHAVFPFILAGIERDSDSLSSNLLSFAVPCQLLMLRASSPMTAPRLFFSERRLHVSLAWWQRSPDMNESVSMTEVTARWVPSPNASISIRADRIPFLAAPLPRTLLFQLPAGPQQLALLSHKSAVRRRSLRASIQSHCLFPFSASTEPQSSPLLPLLAAFFLLTASFNLLRPAASAFCNRSTRSFCPAAVSFGTLSFPASSSRACNLRKHAFALSACFRASSD